MEFILKKDIPQDKPQLKVLFFCYIFDESSITALNLRRDQENYKRTGLA